MGIYKFITGILLRKIKKSSQYKETLQTALREQKSINDEVEKLKPELMELEKHLETKMPDSKSTYLEYYSKQFAKNIKYSGGLDEKPKKKRRKKLD